MACLPFGAGNDRKRLAELRSHNEFCLVAILGECPSFWQTKYPAILAAIYTKMGSNA